MIRPVARRLALLAALAATPLRAEVPVGTPPAPPDIENLLSMPYANWTSEKADTTKAGVTVYDRKRAQPGYNLFTNLTNTVFLMDMNGNLVHFWRFRHARHLEFARITPEGDCYGVANNQFLKKVDKDSNVIWNFREGANHEIEFQPDGTIVTCAKEGMVTYMNRKIRMDGIDFLSPDGRKLSRWTAWPDGQPRFLSYHGKTYLDRPARNPADDVIDGRPRNFDYYHMNSVQVMPKNELGDGDARFAEGNLLISLRNTDTIAILDRETHEVVWTFGRGFLEMQHMPRMLPNGHILLFDNRTTKKKSRVIEFEPDTRKIVWQYPPDDRHFYSAFRGSAQRLPNGNTLICESGMGHFVEVTPDGEIVWEFWNPIFDEDGKRGQVYRVERLIDFDPSAFATGDPAPLESKIRMRETARKRSPKASDEPATDDPAEQ